LVLSELLFLIHDSFVDFDVQAYGAVAPTRRSSGKRIKMILAAAAIAMAVTALVLVTTQDSDVSCRH
jgi:hypothetical protein